MSPLINVELAWIKVPALLEKGWCYWKIWHKENQVPSNLLSNQNKKQDITIPFDWIQEMQKENNPIMINGNENSEGESKTLNLIQIRLTIEAKLTRHDLFSHQNQGKTKYLEVFVQKVG